MEQYSGKSIFNGTAIGRILFYAKNEQQVTRRKVENIEAEIARFEEAKETAVVQLNGLYEKALAEGTLESAE